MLALILGFITGLAGPISNVVSKITDLKQAQVQASTDQEKMKIDAEIAEAHDRKAALIAEAGQRVAGIMNASVRMVLTIGPAALLVKLMLWDKVIGSFYGCTQTIMPTGCHVFKTDPLDTNQWAVITAVIGFYFLYNMAARFRR